MSKIIKKSTTVKDKYLDSIRNSQGLIAFLYSILVSAGVVGSCISGAYIDHGNDKFAVAVTIFFIVFTLVTTAAVFISIKQAYK